MYLKAGCIFWPQIAGPTVECPSLGQHLRCNIAIIGGGITGALVAYYLVRSGIHTVLIDRRQPCQGSTAASTGLLQYEIDTPLCELTERLGWARASRAYQVCYAALNKFRLLAQELHNPGNFTSTGSLYLASKSTDADSLRREYDARRACGIPVDFLNAAQIGERFSFAAPAALWSSRAGEVDPYHFTHALLRSAVGHGLAVFGQTQATGFMPRGSHIIVQTAAGYEIHADKIVMATGYETPELLGRYIAKLSSTYALASQPLASLDGWYQRCLIWETARPYFYARTTADGRAMIGGEDRDVVDPAQRDPLIPLMTCRLTDRFHTMFPNIPIQPQCAWAGTFAQTRDGLPFIGPCDDFPGALFALGYGGNGITFGLIAAEIIRDQMLGVDNPDAALFSFSRAGY